MRSFKIVLVSLAVLLALFVVVGLLLGGDYRVERSVVIDADPGAIHQVVGDLRRWDEWTPWAEENPSVRSVVGQQATGVGASQSWTAKSGDGHLVFVASSPIQGVDFDVFFAPSETPHHAALRYSMAGPATRVSWSMEGEMDAPAIGGWFALLADRMMGPMFERGLGNLRRVVEERTARHGVQ